MMCDTGMTLSVTNNDAKYENPKYPSKNNNPIIAKHSIISPKNGLLKVPIRGASAAKAVLDDGNSNQSKALPQRHTRMEDSEHHHNFHPPCLR